VPNPPPISSTAEDGKGTAFSPKISWKLLGLTLLLAVLLAALAFRGVNWREMRRAVSRAHPVYLASAFALLSISYFVRALRWRILLSSMKWITPFTAFWASEMGYLGNCFLPARAGDVIRTVAISRGARISASYALATLLTERIMDVLALALISVASLSAMNGAPSWLLVTTRLAAAAALAGVSGLLIAPQLEQWLRAGLFRLPLRPSFRARLIVLVAEFLLGLRTLRHWGRAPSFGVLTIVIWLMDGLVAITIAGAFDLRVTLAQALLLLAALGLASSIPTTPGYVGVYQFVAITVLIPFGFSRDQALVYIFALQAVTYVVAIVWGGLGLWRTKLIVNEGVRQIRAASE
jgi:glycosyltransferase 2 family protein